MQGEARGELRLFFPPGEVGLEEGESPKCAVASFSSSSSTSNESQLDAGLSQPREEGLEAGLGLSEPAHPASR